MVSITFLFTSFSIYPPIHELHLYYLLCKILIDLSVFDSLFPIPVLKYTWDSFQTSSSVVRIKYTSTEQNPKYKWKYSLVRAVNKNTRFLDVYVHTTIITTGRSKRILVLSLSQFSPARFFFYKCSINPKRP